MSDLRAVRLLPDGVDATVAPPGSKSIANRALVCAALAVGESCLSNVPDGDDTMAMLAALDRLGVGADVPDSGDAGRTVQITGHGQDWGQRPLTLHAGLAGTTSRFLTALAALGRSPITIDGHPPLRRRPFGPLHDALRQLGATVSPAETDGHLPVTVTGPPIAGAAAIRGDVSSQYVTALMLIGPYLPDGLRLELTSSLVSRPYVEMTAAVMSQFGHDGVEIDDGEIRVTAGKYRPADITVEPDASSASYPLALAAVVGGSITIPGLGDDALQGDARFADLLGEMGCSVVRTPDSVRVERDCAVPLRGIDVDMSDISDLVPTLAVVAALAGTPTTIRGVGFIREKESDRLGDLAAELRLAGSAVTVTDDGLVIEPAQLHGAELGTHHDHRLAMAFGVLGSAVEGIEVGDPGVVSKSWPGFWTMLDELT